MSILPPLLLGAMADQLVDDPLIHAVARQARNEAVVEYVPAPQVFPLAVFQRVFKAMVQGLRRERIAFD